MCRPGPQSCEVSAKLKTPPPFPPFAPIPAARRSRGAGWRPRRLRKTEGAFGPDLAKQLRHLVLSGGANTAPHGPEVGGYTLAP